MTRVPAPNPAHALLDAELATLAALPHRLWASLAGTSKVSDRRGPDGRRYRVKVHARPDPNDPTSIRVTLLVRAAGWFARGRATGSFLSQPDDPTILPHHPDPAR